MKTIYSLLFTTFLASSLLGQEICKELLELQANEAARYEQLTQFQENEFTADYDLRYHRLEWEVDPAVQYIKGAVTSYFIPQTDDFSEINFDLGSGMQVNGVYYGDGQLDFVLHEEDRLQIMLPSVLPVGQLDSIRVEYEGVPATVGFGSFRTSTHNGTPVLWTLSEPYGAKEWWPCKQSLDDKIDAIDIIVRTPSAYRVASNGLLISEVGNEERTHITYHWQHRYPITTYLIAIGVTNYSVFSDFVPLDDERELEILNYVYPESLATAETRFQATVDLMLLFNQLFGEYPFADEKYGHAQFGFGGGMEHQTMSFMGGFSFGLQAHELAHQWFGDKVTCGSWQDIWLNEGFATYLTGLSYEYLDSPQAWNNWKSSAINTVVSQPGGSVYVEDTTSVSRIFSSRLSYNKGALLLHQLRWILGDEHFFAGARQYLEADGVSYDYARTNELQAALEAVSGRALDTYFEQWLYGEGYPSYLVEWSRRENSATGLALRLSQITSHPSVDFFNMPVPVWVSGEGQDTILRLDHQFDGQSWDVPLPFVVDSLVFDPDLWLISANNVVEQVPLVTSTQTLQALGLELYPNPVTDKLFLRLEEPLTAKQVELFNNLGQRVGAWPLQYPLTTLSLGEWPRGIYQLRLPGQIGSWPVIVE